jgi:hypothetical protein
LLFGFVTVSQRPDGTAGKIAKALIFCGPNAFACRAETRIGRDVKWRGAVKETSRAHQRIRIAPCQFERVPRFTASNIALITLIALAATSNLRLARRWALRSPDAPIGRSLAGTPAKQLRGVPDWFARRASGGNVTKWPQRDPNLPLAASPRVGHIGPHGAVAEWLKAAVC